MGNFFPFLEMCQKDKMKHKKQESVSFLEIWLACTIKGAVIGMIGHC